MRELFIQIPGPLQKQIMVRAFGSFAGLAMFFIVLAYGGDWRFLIPAVILTLGCLASAGLMFYQCVKRQYITITGICTEIDRTSIRRRIKAIYFRSDEYDIKLVAPRRIKNLTVGSQITVYVLASSAVYEMDGYKVICNYLALSKGGVNL